MLGSKLVNDFTHNVGNHELLWFGRFHLIRELHRLHDGVEQEGEFVSESLVEKGGLRRSIQVLMIAFQEGGPDIHPDNAPVFATPFPLTKIVSSCQHLL